MMMGLSKSQSCIKYCLFIFNLLFFITGIILISVGATISSAFYSYNDLLTSKFFSLPSFIIAIGIIIMFVTFFGYCGAIKENNCMLLTFSVCMIVIFIFELSGGIAGFVLRNDANEYVKNQMNHSLKTFNESKTSHLIWDKVQEQFSCCGIDSYKDWEQVMMNEDLPMSCCSNNMSNWAGAKICKANDTSSFVKQTGCFESFSNAMQDNAASLGAVGIVISIIQLFGVCLSCYLAKSIRNLHQQF